MSNDTPEKIWATYDDRRIVCLSESVFGWTEYICADLFAELEAENERLTKELRFLRKEHDATLDRLGEHVRAAASLSRTGAVKVKALEYHLAQLRHAYSHLKADGVVDQVTFADGLISPAIAAIETALSALEPAADHIADAGKMVEPAAPEGQQPAAWQWRSRPVYKTSGRKGTWSDWSEGRAPFFRVANYEAEERPLFLRPSEQAVTEAMVDVLRLAYSCGYTDSPGDRDWSDNEARLLDALKAAMEAGRHE